MKRYYLVVVVLVVPAVCLGAIAADSRSDPCFHHRFYDIKLAVIPMHSDSRTKTCFGVRSNRDTSSVTLNIWHLGIFARSLSLRLTGGTQDNGDDYYHILGVDKNCNEDEIKKAYRYSNVQCRSGLVF